mmetsp:Transcript_101/g.145  ORF Transcript_101/g.145 Transcript_101/m.145 type:complete len:370 (-) Transcript_101:207-1316(-)
MTPARPHLPPTAMSKDDNGAGVGKISDSLNSLREAYRLAKEDLSRATRSGTATDSQKNRCREAKALLRQRVPLGDTLLGGCSRTHHPEKWPTGRRTPIAPAVLAATLSPLPQQMRTQHVLRYDVDQYPFRELVSRVLGVSPEELPHLRSGNLTDDDVLGEIEENEEDQAEAAIRPHDALPRPPARGGHWASIWHASQGSLARQEFEQVVHRFVSEFIVPCMDEMDDGQGSTDPKCGSQSSYAYQRDVTFRVQEPACRPVGYLHADADYHHPPSEVNWWIPLTRVWGSNALHIESQPGKGDFAPAELSYGEALCFYGNLCQHHTLANTTGSSRVSFDLRVLPLAYHDPEWVDQRGRRCTFEVGSYYRMAV